MSVVGISNANRSSSRLRRTSTPLALAVLLAIGAVGGALLVSASRGSGVTVVLAGGTVALLYLVVEESLTEAHETVATAFAISTFFAAFLLLETSA